MSRSDLLNTAIEKTPTLSNDELEKLYTSDAYITSLRQFLSEKNTSKALSYWLKEFENTSLIHNCEDAYTHISRSISDIDHLISDQINIIIHDPKFQKLEASWRGLWLLVEQADSNRKIKIKLLDINWAEVTKDIDRALEFDQSQLFNKIYNDEYGIPGGEPYGVIIGDYQISHKPSAKHPHDDISTLEGIAEIAAASFAPFIAGASSEIFGLDNFSKLGQPLNLKTIFSQTEYIKWSALRKRSDSRFIGLTLPRILMREPYRKKPGSYKGLFFYEKTTGSKECSLWGNAAYAFGTILIREFANVGWFGHIRGVPRNHIGGGLLTSLSVDDFETDAEGIAFKPSTEVIVTDALERELSDLGFIPLSQCYNVPFTAFFSNQSIQDPRSQSHRTEMINAKLSSMLQHVLCGARVAHYVKVIIRDKVGSFISAGECESHLQEWLHRYTTGRDDLEWEEQARYPLRRASVTVKEHPEKPGQYSCIIHIVPHYQVDQMVSELELVTELVQGS